MRTIQQTSKPQNDWFYEYRPQIIMVIGTIGLFSKMFVGSEPTWMKISQACGMILLVIALKIMDWRQAYRKAMRRIRA